MARVSISEAARLKGKSRTTLHRLIKVVKCPPVVVNAMQKVIDTSELLRVFGPFESTIL
jgi:hypothetical protein